MKYFEIEFKAVINNELKELCEDFEAMTELEAVNSLKKEYPNSVIESINLDKEVVTEMIIDSEYDDITLVETTYEYGDTSDRIIKTLKLTDSNIDKMKKYIKDKNIIGVIMNDKR